MHWSETLSRSCKSSITVIGEAIFQARRANLVVDAV